MSRHVRCCARAERLRLAGRRYSASLVAGDPAACAARCEREGRCRAWSFSYPGTVTANAMCFLKSQVKPRVESECCVSGVKEAAVLEKKSDTVEFSMDRTGGDYRNLEVGTDPTGANLRSRVQGGRPLPCLDLRAAGLSRRLGALLSEGADHPTAPQAVLRVGRGAVTQRPSCRRVRALSNG